ncbi:Hypothetical protein ETEE_0331 [Edwardsiella anguillarum ET080813]|uniref:Uncharacterized protein n=1 Tax=Edwardsiella anguillarum ET080813 TaxID=667120 RepID=A0A076LM97_9GAMM|nr:Hypothetical protein ETEE_0331 [Edwardsiella anguillarum ET080813]
MVHDSLRGSRSNRAASIPISAPDTYPPALSFCNPSRGGVYCAHGE